MKLDRASEDITRVYRQSDWIPQIEHRPLKRGQLARLCFKADKDLLFSIGKPTRNDWEDLTDDQRVAWLDKGPVKDPMRARLYAAIMEAMKPYAQ